MAHSRMSHLYAVLASTIILVIVAWVLLTYFFSSWLWAHEPIHTTIEAIGGIAAMFLALFLLQREHDDYRGEIAFVATGFLGMGILDTIHGMTHPGVEFVFTHSVASLVGGFWFALIWLPHSVGLAYYAERAWIIPTTGILTLFFGIGAVMMPDLLPSMIVDGAFTTTAIAINVLAGILFMVAVPRFAINYYQTGKGEFFLLLCLALLFGISELMFQYSMLWDAGWWLWHILRLTAYLIALWFVAQGYLHAVAEQRRSQEELRQHRDSLEHMVAERTAELEARSLDLRQNKEMLQAAMQEFSEFTHRVSQGDLTVRLTSTQNGDLGMFAQNLNMMAERLCSMNSQIREATTNITTAAAEILAAATQQAASTSQQSAAVAQTSATLEEIKSIAQKTAQQASRVAQESQTAIQIAQRGTQSVEENIRSMELIRQRVESIAQTILSLSEQTQAIGNITTTVSEIADQSNLLALNAAIEAARAGEQGRSFAIVAQNVRDLAERSKAATVQVREILSEIQRATNAAVLVTEEGTKGVEIGVLQANEAGSVIHQIMTEVEQESQANVQIAAAAHQQTVGIEQIGQAMAAIQQATTQTMASTRQAERAAQDLNQLAQSLQKTVSIYQVLH